MSSFDLVWYTKTRVSDSHPYHADLDPGFQIFADPDPDLEFKTFADTDPGLDCSKN